MQIRLPLIRNVPLVRYAMIYAGTITLLCSGNQLLYAQGSQVGLLQSQMPAQVSSVHTYQSFKLMLPEGTVIAFADGNQFQPIPLNTMVGLLVGKVYRFQVTQIPYNAGEELYPTIEVVGGVNPPQGKEYDFPIEIEISQEDMELALNGKLVTRVIYPDDPQTAVATHGDVCTPLSVDLKENENPVTAAKTLGRPLAILRLGNRRPGQLGSDPMFLFDMPSWQIITKN